MNRVDPAPAQLLKRIEAFAELAPDELELLARYCEFEHYASGETVFSVGSQGEQLFIVVEGEAVVSTHDSYGRVREVARYVAGEAFGELELFSNTVRTVSARCARDARLLVFPRRDLPFPTLIEKHPEVFVRALHRFITVVASRIRALTEQVAESSPYIRQLRTQIFLDTLTGAYNRAYLSEAARLFESSDSPDGALLMVKPDNFKAINDTYGHEGGDAALRYFAEVLMTTIPSSAVVLRYRGNEFCVVCPGLRAEAAKDVAERARQTIGSLDFSARLGGDSVYLTVSIGIALQPNHGLTVDQLAAAAHATMFSVRNAGGDRAVVAGAERSGDEDG